MSEEVSHREDDKALQTALFRYGVIAPLVEQESFSKGEFVELVKKIADTSHYRPGKGALRVSERTIYNWLRLYRQYGIDALKPRWRKDKGTTKVDEKLIDRARELRQESTKRTTRTLLDILHREKRLPKDELPHRSTLDRQLQRLGASRRQLNVIGTRRHIKMQFEEFGELWVGDYHHGPLILAPSGKAATAKLGAFIDHTTRYPVAYRYYLSEDLATLRDTLLRALLTWGPPQKAYVDQGSVYRADQLRYSLDRVGTKLIHSRAYYSEGRGVIERWWQVVLPFEEEVRLREELWTLHELNVHLQAWVELRYLDEIHSELGQTPNQAISKVSPKPLDPNLAKELFLVGEERTVHKKTCCVSVENREFLCESFLKGKRVVVRFDPADLSSVLIFDEGKRVQRAFLRQPNAPPEPHAEKVAPPPSVDYLALLREDYDRQLLEHARPLAYASLAVEESFDQESFIDALSKLANLELTPGTKRELSSFWKTFGPLPEELVRIATEHALRLHGRGRHPQIYLHAIRTLLLAHWKKPPKDSR